MAQSHGYLSSIGLDPVNVATSSLIPPEEKEAQGTNGSSAPSRAKKTGAAPSTFCDATFPTHCHMLHHHCSFLHGSMHFTVSVEKSEHSLSVFGGQGAQGPGSGEFTTAQDSHDLKCAVEITLAPLDLSCCCAGSPRQLCQVLPGKGARFCAFLPGGAAQRSNPVVHQCRPG